MPITPAFPGDPAQKPAAARGEVFVAGHGGRGRTCAPGCNSLLFVFARNVITAVERLADENSAHFLPNNAAQGHCVVVTRGVPLVFHPSSPKSG